MNEVVTNSMATLWDARACATYLGKSPRWTWTSICKRPDEQGSIPHVRVGASPRFIPADIEKWVRQGCPPVSTFNEWNCGKHSRSVTPNSRTALEICASTK